MRARLPGLTPSGPASICGLHIYFYTVALATEKEKWKPHLAGKFVRVLSSPCGPTNEDTRSEIDTSGYMQSEIVY